MNDEQKLDYAKIQDQEKLGNIVFAGIEIMSANLDEFIKQPAEGILYDLNRDKATTISLADDNDNMRLRWINDYAVAVVIEKLKSELERLQSLTQWVRVEDRLPETNKSGAPDFYYSEWVLVNWKYDNYNDDSSDVNKEWEETEKACLMKDRERVYWINYQGYEVDLGEPNAPTVWMPLPLPPEGVK